jgi:hypothetical protein
VTEDYRDWIKQARGDKPIEADPTTGFHPDQLTAYPLARVGPRIYTSRFEALVPAESDVLYVNANEMEDYNRFGLEAEQMFDDVPVFYSVMNSKIPFRGSAQMKIEDFEEIDELEELRKARDRGETHLPNTILKMTDNTDSPGIDKNDLGQVRRKLNGEDVMIQVRPTA